MRSPEHPDVFEVSVGNGLEGYYVVRWDDGLLVWELRDEVASAAPEADEWRAFWRRLDRIGVWDWRDRYERPDVVDGTYWTVNLRHGDRALESSGANAYPPGVRGHRDPTPEFRRFCAAVSELVGAPFE